VVGRLIGWNWKYSATSKFSYHFVIN
jgi:hypothetical protein